MSSTYTVTNLSLVLRDGVHAGSLVDVLQNYKADAALIQAAALAYEAGLADAVKAPQDALAALQATQTALVAQAEVAVASGNMDAIKAVLVAAQTPATELKRAQLLKQQADLAVQLAALPPVTV